MLLVSATVTGYDGVQCRDLGSPFLFSVLCTSSPLAALYCPVRPRNPGNPSPTQWKVAVGGRVSPA
jgi:hypothetical protein